MLTGRAPFEAEMPLSLLIMHVQDPVPAFDAVRPDLVIPAELEAFTRKLLEKEADKRYATAEGAIRALEDLIEGMDDIYRNVVTTAYAETIGLEVATATVTMSDTMLNPSHAQLERTMVSDGTELIASGETQGGSKKWLVLGLLLLLGGGAAIVGIQSSSGDGTGTDSKSPAVVAQSTSKSETTADVASARAVEPDVVVAQPDVRPEPQEITLNIDTDPPGATVWEGETKLGVTPFNVTRAPSLDDQDTVWRLSLEGYDDKTLRFKATANLNQSVALTKARRVRNTKRRVKPPPSTKEVIPAKAPVIKKTPVVVKETPKPKKKPPKKKDPFEFNKVKETKSLGF